MTRTSVLSAPGRTAICFGNGIPVLVTSDADLLDIEEIPLRVQFEESDLPPVQICHPKLLLKAVSPKR